MTAIKPTFRALASLVVDFIRGLFVPYLAFALAAGAFAVGIAWAIAAIYVAWDSAHTWGEVLWAASSNETWAFLLLLVAAMLTGGGAYWAHVRCRAVIARHAAALSESISPEMPSKRSAHWVAILPWAALCLIVLSIGLLPLGVLIVSLYFAITDLRPASDLLASLWWSFAPLAISVAMLLIFLQMLVTLLRIATFAPSQHQS
mgnify:FL=1